MNTNYTPGPWEYRETGKNCGIYSTTQKDECEVDFVRVVHLFGAMSGDDPIADARLIASAPELLDTLEYVLDVAYFNGNDGEDALKKARSAVAKAKGEK